MPAKLRLYDLRVGRLPGLLGLCSGDIKPLSDYINAAQLRLLYAKEAGDEGWFGTFAEIAFTASRSTPYITMSREIARIEALDVCGRPIPLNNQFKEYLQFGNGRMPKLNPWCRWSRFTQGYTRDNVVTFAEPAKTPNPFFIKIFATNTADAKSVLRVLLQGLDSTGSTIYSQDGGNPTVGQFVPIAFPFAFSPMEMTALNGIQKDVTQGAIQIFQSDPTGALPDVLLLTMEPGETTANYRRYYLDHLPCFCCQPNPPQSSPQPVQVNAIVKLEMIPVVCDTDYLLLQNQEAIISECQSIRMSKMDTTTASEKEAQYHQKAIQLLNSELTHYLGKNTPAVQFSPFGSADLRRLRIGMT